MDKSNLYQEEEGRAKNDSNFEKADTQVLMERSSVEEQLVTVMSSGMLWECLLN